MSEREEIPQYLVWQSGRSKEAEVGSFPADIAAAPKIEKQKRNDQDSGLGIFANEK